MILILLVVTLAIVILLSYLLFCESRLFVRRNTLIDLPIDRVGDNLVDLSNWPQWLPWLIYEQDTNIRYEYAQSGVMAALPSCLKWQGKLIKDGFLTLEPARSSAYYYHTLLEAPAFYPNDLHFNIDLTKQGSRTLITMQITAKVAFFKRWTSQQQLVKASRDIELALLKLTAHLAQYSQASHHEYEDPDFEWLGCAELHSMDAVTRPFTVHDQPMSQKMEQGFHDLMVALGPENLPAGPSFALYNKAKPSQHYFAGRLGIPIQNIAPCDVHPERLVFTGRYMQICYTGSYQNLSLAWHVVYNYMRLHHRRRNSRRPGVEIFRVGPLQNVSSKHFVTQVCLPIK